MSWFYEAGGVELAGHEGGTLGVLADGTIPRCEIGGASVPREYVVELSAWMGSGRPGPAPTEAPTEAPTWLMPDCECGWRGTRVDLDPENPREAEEHARTQWLDHVAPVATKGEAEAKLSAVNSAVTDLYSLPPLERIRAAAVLQGRISGLLATAVADARQTGKTWTAIGEPLGLTRGAAHSKFQGVDAAVGLPAEKEAPGDELFNLAACADLDLAARYGKAMFENVDQLEGVIKADFVRHMATSLLTALAHAAGLTGADCGRLAAWARDTGAKGAEAVLVERYGPQSFDWPIALSAGGRVLQSADPTLRAAAFADVLAALTAGGQIPQASVPN